jgi:uncharacterized protein YkwD
MRILFFTFALLLLMTSLHGQIPSGKELINSSNANYEQEVLKLINVERGKRSMKALTWNDQLANSARYHANDMAVDDYFNHDSHDKKNKKLIKICGTFDRIKKFINPGMMARSENIGAGQVTPKDIVKSWMNSPGHKKNILDKDARYIGVGYILKEKSIFTHYWVMNNGI